MGSPGGEAGRDAGETQHVVTLTRGFWIQTTEVPQSRWQALMGNNPSRFLGDADRPVESVSWYDAVAYANALSRSDGLPVAYVLSSCSGTPGAGTFGCGTVTVAAASPYATTGWRLPTESEWEYACRAGTSTPWHWGTDHSLLGAFAWFSGNSSAMTHPVGTKTPNSWGLYDMPGNVAEWCHDWQAGYPGAISDPAGPVSGSYRTHRDGSWAFGWTRTRSAYRGWSWPGYRGIDLGFRLVRMGP